MAVFLAELRLAKQWENVSQNELEQRCNPDERRNKRQMAGQKRKEERMQ